MTSDDSSSKTRKTGFLEVPLYVSCGGGSIEVIKQNDADNYQNVKSIPTVSGARTSLFVPELKLLCLAAPHRGSQAAEIRVFKTQ